MAGAEVSLGKWGLDTVATRSALKPSTVFSGGVCSDSTSYSDWDNMPHKQVGDYPCLLLISKFWIMQTDTIKPCFQPKISRLTKVFQKQVHPPVINTGFGSIPTGWTPQVWSPGGELHAAKSFLGKLNGKKFGKKWKICGSKQRRVSQFGELWRK